MDRQNHPNDQTCTPSVADLLLRARDGDAAAIEELAARAEHAEARAEQARVRAERAQSELRILKYVWLMRHRCSTQYLTSHRAVPRF